MQFHNHNNSSSSKLSSSSSSTSNSNSADNLATLPNNNVSKSMSASPAAAVAAAATTNKTFVLTGKIIHEGLLAKRGRGSLYTPWTLRYMTLDDFGILRYFKQAPFLHKNSVKEDKTHGNNNNNSNLCGSVDIRSCKIRILSAAEAEQRPFAFLLADVASQKHSYSTQSSSLMVAASSLSEMQTWISMMDALIDYHLHRALQLQQNHDNGSLTGSHGSVTMQQYETLDELLGSRNTKPATSTLLHFHLSNNANSNNINYNTNNNVSERTMSTNMTSNYNFNNTNTNNNRTNSTSVTDLKLLKALRKEQQRAKEAAEDALYEEEEEYEHGHEKNAYGNEENETSFHVAGNSSYNNEYDSNNNSLGGNFIEDEA